MSDFESRTRLYGLPMCRYPTYLARVDNSAVDVMTQDEVMDLKLRMKKIQQIMLKCQLDVFLSSNKNNNDKNNNNNNNSSKNKKYNKTSKVFNRLNSEREFICVRDRTD